MSINFTQLAMLIGYMAILVGIGLYMSRRVKSSDDFWVGGRQVGPFATAISCCAAYYSTVAMIGGPPLYYTYGMGLGALELLGSVACCGIFIFVVFGLKMRAVSERVNVVSLPGFLAIRFKNNNIRLVGAAIIAIMMIPYAMSVMKGIGDAMEGIIGIPYTTSIIIIGIVAVIYLVTSGYWGVATTDIIQGITITFAVVLLCIVCVVRSGGVTPIVDAMRAENPALLEIPGTMSWMQIFSWAWVWALIAFGQPQLLTKFMGMKDTRTIGTVVRTSVIWLAVTCLAGNFIGYSGHVLLQGQTLDNFDMLAPALAAQYGGVLVSGIFICGAIAAGLSTLVALCLTSSSAIAKDIYEDYTSTRTGVPVDPKKSVQISRIATAVVMVIVVLLSLDPWDIIWHLSTMAAGAMGAAFTAPLVLGLYWRGGTTAGCISSMVGGALVAVIWYAAGLTEVVHSFVPGTVVSFILFYVVSRLTKPLPKDLVDVFFEKKCKLSAMKIK